MDYGDFIQLKPYVRAFRHASACHCRLACVTRQFIKNWIFWILILNILLRLICKSQLLKVTAIDYDSKLIMGLGLESEFGIGIMLDVWIKA